MNFPSDKPIRKFHLSESQYRDIARILARQTGWSERIVHGHRTAAQMVALLRDTMHRNDCIYHAHTTSPDYTRALRPIHEVHHIRGRGIAGDYPRHCVSLCVECHRNVTDHQPHPTNAELQNIVDSLASYYDVPKLLRLDYESHEDDIQVYIDEYQNWKWNNEKQVMVSEVSEM